MMLSPQKTYLEIDCRISFFLFQLCLGNSAPFLALVGVSLASGSGLITKEDELECVCREVGGSSLFSFFLLNRIKLDSPLAARISIFKK